MPVCQTADIYNYGNVTITATYKRCSNSSYNSVSVEPGATVTLPCMDYFHVAGVNWEALNLQGCDTVIETLNPTLTPIGSPIPTNTPTPTPFSLIPTATPTPTPGPAACVPLFVSASTIGTEAHDWYIVDGEVSDCSSWSTIPSNIYYYSSSVSIWNNNQSIPVSSFGPFTNSQFSSGIEICTISDTVTIIVDSPQCGTQCIEVTTDYIPNTPTPTPTPTATTSPNTPTPSPTPTPTPTPTPQWNSGVFRNCADSTISFFADYTTYYNPSTGNQDPFPTSGTLQYGNVVQIRMMNPSGQPTGASYCCEFIGASPGNIAPTHTITVPTIIAANCSNTGGQPECFQ